MRCGATRREAFPFVESFGESSEVLGMWSKDLVDRGATNPSYPQRSRRPIVVGSVCAPLSASLVQASFARQTRKAALLLRLPRSLAVITPTVPGRQSQPLRSTRHTHVFGAAGVDPVRRRLEDGLDPLQLAGHGGVVKVVPSLRSAEAPAEAAAATTTGIGQEAVRPLSHVC